MKAHVKSKSAPSPGEHERPKSGTKKATKANYTRQYYPKFTQLPQPGEIRELCDRSGNVAHLAKVISTDPRKRTAALQVLQLNENGREV